MAKMERSKNKKENKRKIKEIGRKEKGIRGQLRL